MPWRVGATAPEQTAQCRLSLWSLVCTLALATGSIMSPTDAQGTSAAVEEWNATTIRLQPDLQTEAQTEEQTESITTNYTGLSCDAVLPPRRGSFYVESGTGVSVGTVLAFWCREGYQLVGSDRIYCNVKNSKPQWSNYLPVCEAIPRPEDRGLRVAVLASVVSGIVILAMSLSFLICCLQERTSRRRANREVHSRRRETRSAHRSECWLEREEAEWDAFPPPKIFHLSQRIDPSLAPDSPLYLTGGLTGYENRGYQRSQESLLKAPLPGLYRSESQLYSHVVLQRVPTPTAPSAPSYLPHSSPSSSNAAPHPPTLSYHGNISPAPATVPAPIYPNPKPAPQHPWQ